MKIRLIYIRVCCLKTTTTDDTAGYINIYPAVSRGTLGTQKAPRLETRIYRSYEVLYQWSRSQNISHNRCVVGDEVIT